MERGRSPSTPAGEGPSIALHPILQVGLVDLSTLTS